MLKISRMHVFVLCHAKSPLLPGHVGAVDQFKRARGVPTNEKSHANRTSLGFSLDRPTRPRREEIDRAKVEQNAASPVCTIRRIYMVMEKRVEKIARFTFLAPIWKHEANALAIGSCD